MKTSKVIGFLGLIVTAFAAMLPISVNASEMCSVEVYQDSDTGMRVYPNSSNPAVYGETVKFRILLSNGPKAWTNAYFSSDHDATGKEGAWGVKYIGNSEEMLDNLYNPLRLWIMVGNQRRGATLQYCRTAAETDERFYNYTELIFSYKVRAGDFALPITFARNSDGTLSFENSDKWWFKNKFDESCVFLWNDLILNNSVGTTYPGALENEIDYNYVRDDDLSKTGIYVQAIDFDSYYSDNNSTPKIWRTISAGSTSADARPALEIPQGAEDSVELYVWTTNSSVAYVEGDNIVSENPYRVLKVSVKPNDTNVFFNIKGAVGAEGMSTEVFLSSYQTNRFNNGVKSWTERTITVTKPEPPSVTVVLGNTTIDADDEYSQYKTTLNVKLSQTYTKDVKVKINSAIPNSSIVPLQNYVGISDSSSADGENFKGTDTVTITIPAGKDTLVMPWYVFALGANDETASNGIVFTPEIVDDAEADAFFSGKRNSATLYIKKFPPEVEVLSPPTKIPCNEDVTFTLQITDTYRGLFDFATGGRSPYKVRWSWDGGVTFEDLGSFTTVGGNQIEVTTRCMDEGDGKNVRVEVENADGIRSNFYEFTIDVAKAKRISANIINVNGVPFDPSSAKRFNEGDELEIEFVLTEPFKDLEEAYIYLEPRDEESRTLVECDAFTEGVLIERNLTNSTATAYITLLDGTKDTRKGLKYDLRICKEDEITIGGGTPVSGWGSKLLTLVVNNVEPTVKSASVNGVDISVSGGVVGTTAAKGVTKTFNAIAYEPSDFDRNATDDDSRFVTKWVFNDGGNPTTKYGYGNPGSSAAAVTHQFFHAGTNTVKVQMKDKDMADFPDESFEFKIITKDKPAVSIGVHNGSTEFLETDVGPQKGRINVTLTEPASEDLVVEVRITRVGQDDGNYPIPELSNEASSTATERIGTITFIAGATEGSFYFADMDGTDRSASRGFRLSARVITDTLNDDGVAYSSLYSPVEAFDITVVNEAPQFMGDADTNRVDAVVNVPIRIDWSVTDIEQDLTNGLLVTLTYEGKTIEFETGKPNATDTWFNVATNFVFTYPGDKTVTLTVRDKDRGIDRREFYYTVGASQTVTVIPVKPGASQTAYASEYANANGVGVGRVWAGSSGIGQGKLTGISAFWQSWDYDPSIPQARVFAKAYKAGDIDDGSLKVEDELDIPITPKGKWAKTDAEGYYTDTVYPDHDNFFYKWVQAEAVETSKEIVGVGLGLEIEGKSMEFGAFSQKDIIMPDADQNSGAGDVSRNYSPAYMEAIFSREYYTQDNVGDINADRIPDIFVAQKWQNGYIYKITSSSSGGQGSQPSAEQNSATVDATEDLNEFTNFNNDDDYLPAKSAGVSSLIPGQINTWALVGQPFKAVDEIRGYGEGLNLRMSHNGRNLYAGGTWISEPDYTDAEVLAWAKFHGNTETDIATLRTQLTADNNDSWSPENRTDPTVADTDGDGYPDGYEYYFWYNAHVGWIGADGKLVQLTGEKFNLRNIAKGDLITSEEIAQKFNPTVARSINVRLDDDTDQDGLSDLEELAIGTNPVHWDSDGDGINDLWEVMNGMDPLDFRDASSVVNGANADGDFMASHVVTNDDIEGGDKWAVVTIPNMGIYAVPNNGETEDGTLEVTDGVLNVTNINAIAVFRYGNDKADVVPKARGIEKDADKKVIGILTLAPVDVSSAANVVLETGVTLRLIHDQVYNTFGFDPRTAWNKTKDGYVASRWSSASLTAAAEGDSGLAVDTEPYTALDEYLLLKYRYETKMVGFDVDADIANVNGLGGEDKSVGQVLSGGTTLANIPYENKVYGTNVLEVTSNIYGADTDGDGMPDGWELYVGYNPNSPDDGLLDDDEDGLTAAQEYAGTDSCNVYEPVVTVLESGETSTSQVYCTTVYANHPGNLNGWFNKFFPTDPNNKDTDGDHIKDGDEGKPWEGTARCNNISGQDGELPYSFSFIYGNPVDDGLCCIRGGGMNPCSVDTDMDMLPDPWEKQFAGVVFNENGQPTNLTLSASAIEIIRRSDGLYGDAKAVAPYITIGMDATYGPHPTDVSDCGDAYTSMHTDPRTGTKRNFDFDHDGLENYQEYLVQTLRHLRYDDSETPLMSSYILENGAAPTFLQDSFLKMQTWDGASFAETARKAGFTGAAGKDFKFRELGYFAVAPRHWDRVALNKAGLDKCKSYDKPGYRILLPPQGLSEKASVDSEDRLTTNGKYVSTDPRMADSDGDGMDDFYELFHGLNPLLGTTNPLQVQYDLIGNAYGASKCSAFRNAWTMWAFIAATFDPLKYPWFIGTPDCDADGDGLSNMEEMIQVNTQSPQVSHTDPTPLWMTDSSSPHNLSWTSQYYFFNPYGDSDTAAYSMWGSPTLKYMFAFEENEGYDTDGDNNADGAELTGLIDSVSDPLNFMDPMRRQALWFPGENSAAVSHSPMMYRTSVVKEYSYLQHFTVEAWIRPENVSRKQIIIERSVLVGSSTLSNNTGKVKANFRLGITEDGRLYGSYDSMNAVDTETEGSYVKIIGNKLNINMWTHIALSYDGNMLRLYINGKSNSEVASNMKPANGINVLNQSASPDLSDDADDDVEGTQVSMVMSSMNAAIIMGARGLNSGALQLGASSAWSDYDDFYVGAIDEVRIWDGARKSEEIDADRTKRYTLNDVNDNRLEVFKDWCDGATRNDNDGKDNLPSELIFHYNFQTLPGAIEASNVATLPVGFTKYVLHNIAASNKIPTEYIECGWWASCPLASTVYDSYEWIPWIHNTVSHLPPFDGSAPDSIYWSSYLCGFTFAGETGLDAYIFPNTANPYHYTYPGLEAQNYEFRLDKIFGAIGERDVTGKKNIEEIIKRYNFSNRSAYAASKSTALLPLGGAFAKRMVEMWDGNGAASAWANTGVDRDSNGFPDWWEKYAKGVYSELKGVTDVLTKEMKVTRNGVVMSLREAYLRDLVAGLVPNANATGGELKSEYADKADVDYDGLPDWWENIYGITSSVAQDDSDNDQLSNWAEYLIGEGFVKYGFPMVSPISMRTGDGQEVPDYYLAVGQLYLGEMFADHDFMEESWEALYDVSMISRAVYDPWDDPDDDGWSNFAECRAATDPTKQGFPGLDGFTTEEYPIPTVNLKVKYNGNGTLNAPLYVKAYSDYSMIPDAVWTVGTGVENEKYIGYNPNKEITIIMGPASVEPGSVKLYFKSTRWYDSDGYVHTIDDAPWCDFVVDRMTQGDTLKGVLIETTTDEEVGTIDYKTGEVVVDLTKMKDEHRRASDTSEGDSTYYVKTSYVKLAWKSVITTGLKEITLNLTTPLKTMIDEGSGFAEGKGTQYSKGLLCEGKNTFIAWLDKNDNGLFDMGEPYGVVTDVDVGWNKAAAELELSEITSQLARINLGDLEAEDFATINAATDRGATGLGTENQPLETLTESEESSSGSAGEDLSYSKTVRIRLVRNMVNGAYGVSGSQDEYSDSYGEVVYDKIHNVGIRQHLTETDLAVDGILDLDWGFGNLKNLGFTSGSTAHNNITNVSYRVVVGEGDVGAFENQAVARMLPFQFVNVFERGATPTPITPVSPVGGMVLSGSPTFKWMHTNTVAKVYPAFRLKVWNDEDQLIYDSGSVRTPVKSSDGVYSWTAPIYEGMVTPEGYVFSTKDTYRWSITMLDAKFTEFPANATEETFRLNATSNKYDEKGYGAIQVAVKYFGPLSGNISTEASKNGLKNMIRVQAFENPDFTGRPVSEAYVTDIATLSSATSTNEINAVIRGLPVGKVYYIRAYVDTNASNTKENWESWGYSNYIGNKDVSKVFQYDSNLLGLMEDNSSNTIASDMVYAPKAVSLELDGKPTDQPVIFIEDADTDNDGLPDAWEMNTAGTLGTKDAPTGNTFFAKVNPDLEATLAQYNIGLDEVGEGSGSGYMPLLASILSGSETVSYQAAMLLGAEAVATEGTARITNFSLEDGVEIEVDTETKIVNEGSLPMLFSTAAPETVEVGWSLRYSDTLDGEFVEVDSGTITVNNGVAEKANINAVEAAKKSEKYSEKQGFFKVYTK